MDLPQGPVADETRLLRRISPRYLKPGARISKGAFQNTTDTDEMSVVIEDTLQALGCEPASVLEGFEGYGLAALTAGFVRTEEQDVRRSPKDDEQAHGDVIGTKSNARRKRFAAFAAEDWIVQPG